MAIEKSLKGTTKIFSFFAPPREGDDICEFEGQILAIVRQFGTASLSDITIKLNPNYDTAFVAKSPRFSKIRFGFVMATARVSAALLRLAKLDCIRIVNGN